MYPALHGVKQVVVKVWDFNGLVYHKVIGAPSSRIVISYYSGHCLVDLRAEARVIGLYGDRTAIVMNDKGVRTHNTRISVVVNFYCGCHRRIIHRFNTAQVTQPYVHISYVQRGNLY